MRYADAARALLRDTLLDAAADLLEDRPWGKVSMADVAQRAGVSRQTLYNELGSRQELAEALVMREAERLMAGAEREIEANADDPRAAVRGALRSFLEAAADSHLVRIILSEEGLLGVVTTRGAVAGFASERLTGVLLRTWPGLRRADARTVCDVVVRLAISHAALPGGPPAQTARQLATVLGPHLDELVRSLPRTSTHAA